jgi:hypothetical protein
LADDPARIRTGKPQLPPTTAGMNKIAPIDTGKDDKGTYLGATPEDEDDAKLLERIRKRMELCVKKESGNRKAAIEDRKFMAGDQWPADEAAKRNTDHRPCLTINKLPTFVNQITNDQRQNRPAINVSPIGDKSTKDAAKMYKGMIRAIERDSVADIAYDTAFSDAVVSGFGYWRILTEYESPDSLHQVIVIKRVRNPFTVYLDPFHQEPDGSDSRYGFITERIPREDFEDEYPDADPVPFLEGGAGESFKDWIGKDDIRIAEYFEIKTKKRTYVKLANGHEGWKDELSDSVRAKMDVLEEREADVPAVKWYKVNAMQVLAEADWLGQWIPIVKVIGNEIDIEGDVKISGLIRNAKDAQRMMNYWETSATELIALAPKAPWLVEEGQIEGHERQWKEANRKSFPFLQYKGTSLAGKPVPPPQRQQFAGVPAGVQQALQNSAEHMIATTGVRFDATKQERMNDESGVAVRELGRKTDLGSFHYVDNLCRSLRHSGRILVDLIPKVYDEKRIVTILNPDDTEESIQIDPHQNEAFKEQPRSATQTSMKVFNPTMGRYGVTITIGPSFATKRVEAAESMMAFAKAMPQSAQLIADLIAKYQDWEGAEEMASRLAKAVPAQFLTADQKDIPPQVQAMIQNLESQVKQITGQLQAAMKELDDKGQDRQIAKDKIERDFEAKIIAVIQKAEAVQVQQVGSKIDRLAEDLNRFIQSATLDPKSGGASSDAGATVPGSSEPNSAPAG